MAVFSPPGKLFWLIENPNQDILGVALDLIQERIDKVNKKTEDELKAIETVSSASNSKLICRKKNVKRRGSN